MFKEEPEISIILPCLNEEESVGKCLNDIKEVIKKNNLNAEIIIVDNGSSDNSINEVRKNSNDIKGKLIRHEKRGYGSAYLKGIESAKGKYIFMADSDGSYDFYEIPKFIEGLRNRYDFVIGNRFKGDIERGSMPFLNRYIGNPILSGILKFFFNVNVHDSHCGMRAIRKDALQKLNLSTTGMEFASEMVLKAGKRNLKIKELPINYHKRKGRSKLRSFPDAWRHMRLMLIYSPLYLFFIPGIIIILLGILLYITLLINWISGNFDALTETRKSIIALTLITLGIETIFSSFMLSILGMKED